NAQYPKIEIKEFASTHDRFLILDEKEIYHIGASLKDLGKKWFAFSLMGIESFGLMEKIKKVINHA
ncbi:MAG: ORF6N domain-containing protein, partial [Sulfuricurvum sp.]|nr:ORF6N domain-containing protein [Sulfuricurvum sp.]